MGLTNSGGRLWPPLGGQFLLGWHRRFTAQILHRLPQLVDFPMRVHASHHLKQSQVWVVHIPQKTLLAMEFITHLVGCFSINLW